MEAICTMKNGLIRGLLVLTSLFLFTGCSEETAKIQESSHPDNYSQAADKEQSESQTVPDSDSDGSEKAQGENKRVPGVSAKVLKVVDGDTIDVLYKGEENTVRMLLIDTPETHHPRKGVQPYGPEASDYSHHLMDGKTVRLELAAQGGRDKYGRLLAYVYADGKSVEESLLARGLARVAYVIPPNTKYVDRYRAIEAQAKNKRLGIWSVDGYAREDGYHPDVMKGTSAYEEAQPKNGASESGGSSVQDSKAKVPGQFAPDNQGSCGGAIKGNISERGKIYHMPSDAYYKATKAEACFKTREAAREAGFRAAK
ncbi:nuclease [Sporolactobacillus sp. THM7-7]|nr:nuclease [Sporolactobacillus sp. THM7-7]